MRCYELGGGCAGSFDGYCWPYNFWSGSYISASLGYQAFWLAHGAIFTDTRVLGYAFSVRLLSFASLSVIALRGFENHLQQ